jgi:acyl dehydratase
MTVATPDAVEAADLAARVSTEIGVSDWLVVDQGMIDAFAAVTDDLQFIHTDPERAKAETPFGGTIAHGMLTLSLLVPLVRAVVPPVKGLRHGLNYGFDRVRFLAPVPAGARIRGRFVLKAFEERAPGEITATLEATVEIEGQTKPALVATWLSRRYLEAPVGLPA